MARERSITKAASQVCLSQPAVTHAINKMENELGVQLFKRQHNGMFLTDAGEVFIGRINQMLQHLQEGFAQAIDLCKDGEAACLEKMDQVISSSQIRALLALAELRNFSLAAQALGVSRTALHKAARDLEFHAGVGVFRRSMQGVALTPVGQVLADHFGLALNELERAYEALDTWKGYKNGVVVIGYLSLPLTSMVTNAINHLKQENPKVQVRVVNSPYDHQIQGLRSGKIDMILGALWNDVPLPGVQQEVLCEDQLIVIARKDHPTLHRPNNTFQDLLLYPWVLPPSGVPPQLYLDQMVGHGMGLRFDDIIECPSIDLMMQLLQTSNRLGLATQMQMQIQMQQGNGKDQVGIVGTAEPLCKKSTMLLTRSDLHPTSIQAQFMDMLRQAAKEELCP